VRLAAWLSTELGLALADVGETMWDLVEHDGNRATLEDVSSADLASALARGAASGGRVATVCIEALVLALRVRDGGLDGGEVLDRIGRRVDVADAGAWIASLVAAAQADPSGGVRALQSLRDLVALELAWPDAARPAVCNAVLPLAMMLDGPGRREVAEVLEQLARHHTEFAGELPAAVPRLCEMLADAADREIAAAALGAIGEPSAVSPLLEQLRGALERRADATAYVRALGELRAAEAVTVICDSLERTTGRHARDYHIIALARIDPVRAAPVLARVENPRAMNAYVLGVIEAGAVAGDPVSLAWLDRAAEGGDMRGPALVVLAKVRGAVMFDRLDAAARDPDADVRAHAANGLRELRDPRAFEALVMALEGGNPIAAIALGELGHPRAIPPLVDALAIDYHWERDVPMKEAVIEALGDLGVPDAHAWAGLVRRLHHHRNEVVECAALACQQLRPGCRTGHAALIRRIAGMSSSDPWRAGDASALFRRLASVARRGLPPQDRAAAGEILAVLESRQRADSSLDGLADAAAAWRGWLYGARRK
jgi:HEAT repeat protein